jgi:hypothetical protein
LSLGARAALIVLIIIVLLFSRVTSGPLAFFTFIDLSFDRPDFYLSFDRTDFYLSFDRTDFYLSFDRTDFYLSFERTDFGSGVWVGPFS